MKRKLIFFFSLVVLCLMAVPLVQAQQTYDLRGDSVRVYWNGQWQSINEDGSYPFYVASTGGGTTGGTTTGGGSTTGGGTAGEGQVAFVINFSRGVITMDTTVLTGTSFFMSGMDEAVVINEEQSLRFPKQEHGQVDGGGTYILYAYVLCNVHAMMSGDDPATDMETIYACGQFAIGGSIFTESGRIHFVDATGETHMADLVILPSITATNTEELQAPENPFHYTYVAGVSDTRSYDNSLTITSDTIISRYDIYFDSSEIGASCYAQPIRITMPSSEPDSVENDYAFGCGGYTAPDGQYYTQSGIITYAYDGEIYSLNLQILPVNMLSDIVEEQVSAYPYTYYDEGLNSNVVVPADTVLMRYTFDYGEDDDYPTSCTGQYVKYHLVGGDQPSCVDDTIPGGTQYETAPFTFEDETGTYTFTSDTTFTIESIDAHIDDQCSTHMFITYVITSQQPTCVDDTIPDTQLERVPFTYQTATGASVVISQDTTFTVETVIPHENDRCFTHKIVTYVVYTDTTQQQPTIDTTLVVKEECDSFYWDVTGMAYTTSGRYEGRTATSNGVFILDLTINNSINETIDTAVYSGYVFNLSNYSDGVLIVNDTTLYEQGQTDKGCQLFRIWNFTAREQQPTCADDTITDTQLEQVPFTYQTATGASVVISQDTTFSVETVVPHDNDRCLTHKIVTYVVYTDTTQQQPTIDTTLVSEVKCDSFYWNVTGMVYTTSGRYEGRTATSNGVFILDLTINNSKSETIDTTVQSGYVFYSRNYSDGVLIVSDTTLYEQGQTDKGCQLFRVWNITAIHQQPTCVDDTITDTQLEQVPFTYQTATGASVVISQDTTFSVETVVPHDNDRCLTHKIVTYVVYTDTTQQQPTIDTTLVVKEECDSFYWDVTGMAYTTSGRYEGRTATSNGVFILDLTINNSKSETIDTTVQSGYVFYSRNYSDGVLIENDTILYEQGQTDKGCQLFRVWNITAIHQQPTCVDDTITDTQLEQVPFTYQTATGASIVISQDTTFSVETVVPHDNDRCLTHKIVTYVVYTDTTHQQPTCINDTVRTDQYEVAPFTYQTNTGATRVITRDTVFTVEKRMQHENDQCYTYTMVTISVNVDTTNISQCSNDTMVRVIDEFAPYAFGGMMLYEDTTFFSIAPHTADRCTTFVVTNIHLMPACQEVVSTMSDSACGSYVWRGRTIQRTGRYIDTVRYAVNNRCDSIYIINLVVMAQRVETEEYYGYGSYDLDLGNGTTATITADTMFRISNTTPDGCTKVRSITIHITPVANTDTTVTVEPTIDTVSACVSYTWHGRTYRQSGVYTDPNTNDVLMLTIGQRSFTQLTEEASGSYTYGGHTYTASAQIFDTLTNMDGCDSIVIISLRVRTVVEANVTACDQYHWANGDGRVYTNSGIYFDSASMTRLNLRIRHSSTSPVQNVTNCGNFTWNGLTYYRSGVYRVNLPGRNMDGCDSLDIINLTIRNTGYSYNRQVVCNSYEWHGTTLTSSGVYTYLDSSNVCQTAEIVYLTIRHCGVATDASGEPGRARKSTIDTTVCDYFEWDVDGQTYTHSGIYTAAGHTLNLTVKQSGFGSEDSVIYEDSPLSWHGITLSRDTAVATILTGASANGCDSIASIYIKTVPRTILNEDACDSYTWNRNGQTYTSDVTVEDFPVTLNLTIKHSSAATYRCEACENYLWENGVTYVASTTTPSRVIENAEGCDSVITLNLTLNHATSGIDQRTESGSYTWINGETYTANAVAQYTIEEGNNAGCDSLVVLALTIVEAGTEGISDVESLPVTIYPNPAVERITIAGVKVLRAELYNVAGTPVRKVENATSVNIGGLPSGIYMLRIFTPDGTAVRRVIKR